jgi:hypothetical protein
MGAERSFAMPDATWNVVERSLPQKGTLVKYRTSFSQMLGYRDGGGRWVASDGFEESLPVKSWTSIYQRSSWPERLA